MKVIAVITPYDALMNMYRDTDSVKYVLIQCEEDLKGLQFDDIIEESRAIELGRPLIKAAYARKIIDK